MVAGEPECYPVMFVYTPDGFPHKTDRFMGLEGIMGISDTECNRIPPRHLSRIPV